MPMTNVEREQKAEKKANSKASRVLYGHTTGKRARRTALA